MSDLPQPSDPRFATKLLDEMYRRVKREPRDGSLAEAIKIHAQACGLVAYTFDIHPDEVARCVKAIQRTQDETWYRTKSLLDEAQL